MSDAPSIAETNQLSRTWLGVDLTNTPAIDGVSGAANALTAGRPSGPAAIQTTGLILWDSDPLDRFCLDFPCLPAWEESPGILVVFL